MPTTLSADSAVPNTTHLLLEEKQETKIDIRFDPNEHPDADQIPYWFGPQGQGAIHYPDGSYYGAWQSGRYHGIGTRTYLDGSSYNGMWHHGKRQGTGTMVGDYDPSDNPTPMTAVSAKAGGGEVRRRVVCRQTTRQGTADVLQ